MDRTDQELIAGVLAGEQDGYAELVRRHHARVMGVCLSMLGDAASAEDAAQDCFLKAYRSLADFQGQAAFGTWLYRIAANRCLDLLRRRTRRAGDGTPLKRRNWSPARWPACPRSTA